MDKNSHFELAFVHTSIGQICLFAFLNYKCEKQTLVNSLNLFLYAIQKNTFVEFRHSVYLNSKLFFSIGFSTPKNVCMSL